MGEKKRGDVGSLYAEDTSGRICLRLDCAGAGAGAGLGDRVSVLVGAKQLALPQR